MINRPTLKRMFPVLLFMSLGPGCGTVYYNPPTQTNPYFGLYTTNNYKYNGVSQRIENASTFIHGRVIDEYLGAYGSVYEFGTATDWKTGTDGKRYVEGGRVRADWRFENLSGPCDGFVIEREYVEHAMIYPLQCIINTTVTPQSVGILIDGSEVYTGGTDKLVAGESLYSDNSKTSADGRFTLYYQGDGNLVLYQGGSAIWQSGTAGTCPGQTSMQGDGNLVVYDCNWVPAWTSNTVGNNDAFLVVQSDGNTVIYSSDGSSALWSTGTGGR